MIYLYGFVPAGTDPPPADLAGIDERPVEILVCGSFAAAISRLPDSWGSAEDIDARLQDMDWVARHGLAHEGAVAWFVDRGDIVPAAFLTLFSSPEALQGQAAEREADILEQLDRVRGLREWDMKVGYVAERLAENLGELSEDVAELDRAIEAAGPGRRFLLEKKRKDVVDALTARTARELASDLLDELRARARDSRVLPLPRAGEGVPVVLSAALLLPTEQEAAVGRIVERRGAELERLGLTISFSGPWAPYRFLEAEEPGDGAAVRKGPL